MQSHQQSPSPMADPPRPRLTKDIQTLAYSLYHHVPDLTKQEKQFLQDQGRREGHTSKSLDRMAVIAERSPDPADRHALGRSFLARAMRRERDLAGVSIVALEDEETLARHRIEVAERRRLRQDSPETRRAEAEELLREMSVCERTLHVLEARG